MNRRLRGTILAAAAGLALPAASFGQITWEAPRLDAGLQQYEYFGLDSVNFFSIDGADFTDTENLGFAFEVFAADAAGNTDSVGTTGLLDTTGGVAWADARADDTLAFGEAITDAAAGADTPVAISIPELRGANATFSTVINSAADRVENGDTTGLTGPAVAAFLVITADNIDTPAEADQVLTAPTGALTAASSASRLIDGGQPFVFNAAATAPHFIPRVNNVLDGANIDADNDTVNAISSRPVQGVDLDISGGGAAADTVNGFTTTALGAGNFEFDEDGDFGAGATNPGSAADGITLSGNDFIVQVEFDAADVPSVGDFFRFSNDGGFTDFVGYALTPNQTPAAVDIDDNGTELIALADLAVTAAEWTDNDTVLITFNNILTTLPSRDLFIIQDQAGNDLEVTLTTPGAAVASGPEPNQVIIDVANFDPGDSGLGIEQDGLFFDSDTGDGDDSALDGQNAFVFIEPNAADVTTDPVDIFGDTFGSAGDVSFSAVQINDGIEPTNTPTFAYVDADGDGFIETIAIIFNEPVSLTATPAATDFNIGVTAGTNIVSPDGFDEFGNYANPLPTSVATMADFDPTAVAAGQNVRFNTGEPARLDQGNAIFLTIDPSAVDWTGDGAGTNRPGTDDNHNHLLTVDHPTITVTDGSSDNVDVSAATNVSVNTDRALPAPVNFWYFTGDNINNTPPNPNSISQLLGEVGPNADSIGDQDFNDLLAVVFSESINTLGDWEDLVQIDGTSFNANGADAVSNPGLAGNNNNIVVLENRADGADGDTTVAADDEVAANPNLLPGALIDYPASTDTLSLPQNAAHNDPFVPTSAGARADRPTLYSPSIEDQDNANATLDSAFLIDDDDDDLADRILVQLTQAIDGSAQGFDDAFNDFTVTGLANVTVTDIETVSGNPASFFLTLGGANVSMNATNLNLVYDGAQAQDPDDNGEFDDSRLLRTLAGNPLSPVTTTLTEVQQVQIPEDGPFVATQTFEGTALVSTGTPFPVGTRLVAYLGVPVVQQINATHNGVAFDIDIRGRSNNTPGSDENSLEAFIDLLYGVENFLYLQRDNDNLQTFTNFKDSNNDDNNEVVRITVNAANLSNITFNGTGEVGLNNSANGTARLCWDLLRSTGGTLDSFFETGYEVGGNAVPVGQTVITNTDGTYTLDVTAPSARFNSTGLINFNTVGQPIILLAFFPSGEIFPLSTLNANIDLDNPTYGRGPILFNAENTRQNGTSAPGITSYDINLENAGPVFLEDEWNLLGYPRAGGFVNNAGDIPALPAGINQSTDIVQGTTSLALDDAFDQFFYWTDENRDGMWTQADLDAGGRFWIDEDCFDNFNFAADSFGVDLTADGFVGGYAAGFYNGTGDRVGVTQFGSLLDEGSIFPSGTTFPNNPTTLGWGTFTLTQSGGYTDVNDVETSQSGNLDNFIIFTRDEDGNVVIFNANSGNESFGQVPFGTTIFGHYTP